MGENFHHQSFVFFDLVLIFFCSCLSEGENGFKRVRDILKLVGVRRTKESKVKGKPIIEELPQKNKVTMKISFTRREREIYDELKHSHARSLRKMDEEGSIMKNYRRKIDFLLVLLPPRKAS